MKEKYRYAGLLASTTQHLDRGIGLSSRGSGSTGLAGLFLRNKIRGHIAKLGHSLLLAAAGAESYCRNNRKDESGEFHKTEYG